jgi:hypothetical protein
LVYYRVNFLLKISTNHATLRHFYPYHFCFSKFQNFYES